MSPPPRSPVPTAPAVHPHMPLEVVLNASSGKHGKGEVEARLRALLEQAGVPHQLHVARRPRALGPLAVAAADAAQRGQGALVVAGGDGTLNTVAAQAWRRRLPLGVLPQGTFNYFGRAHALSQVLEEACETLLTGLAGGQVQPVQIGLLNDELFLVNASVGLYPQVLQDREAFKQRYGRSRLVAAWAALRTVLKPHRELLLRLQEGDAPERAVRTPTLFVGNNPLQMERLGLPEAERVGQGDFAVLTLAPIGRLALLKLGLLGALGQLGEADAVHHSTMPALWVEPTGAARRRPLRVALDGETRWQVPPLRFEVAHEPLWLIGAAPTAAREA